MSRRRTLRPLLGIAALALVLAASSAAPAAAVAEAAAARDIVTLSIEVAAPASLFNLVDRLSDWRDIDDDEPDPRYLAIWEEAVGELSDDDAAALQRWRELRRRYRGAPLDGGGLVASLEGAGLPFPVATERLRLEDKLAIAFLGAADWADLDRRLELVLAPSDQAVMDAVVDHVRERLGPTLRRSLHLDAVRARLGSWARRTPPAPFLARLARFLHTPADRPLDFVVHLVWLPPDATQTRATVVERHAALEVPAEPRLRAVMDVAVHELVHRLEERMPRAVRARLDGAFLTAPGAAEDGTYAVAAANLAAEGLATALGQGLFVAELFPGDRDPERTWYDDPGYDAFAKLVAPIAAPYVAQGRPMDEAFVHALVARYAATFAPDTAPPWPDVLRRAVVLSDDPAARARARGAIAAQRRPKVLLDYPLGDALVGASPRTAARAALATFPALPVVVLATPADRVRLTGLAVSPPVARETFPDAGVTVVRRPRAAPVFVAIGATPAAAAAAFAAFLR